MAKVSTVWVCMNQDCVRFKKLCCEVWSSEDKSRACPACGKSCVLVSFDDYVRWKKGKGRNS